MNIRSTDHRQYLEQKIALTYLLLKQARAEKRDVGILELELNALRNEYRSTKWVEPTGV